MPKNDRGGQAIVEFAVAAVATQLAVSAMITVAALTAATVWLRVETFSKARARLYGQRHSCESSPAWPANKFLRLDYHDDGAAKARGELWFGSQQISRVEIDLAP